MTNNAGRVSAPAHRADNDLHVSPGITHDRTPVESCPSCGYRLSNDNIGHQGDWHFDPRGVLFFKNRTMDLTKTEAVIAGAIFNGKGRPLHREHLAGSLTCVTGSNATENSLVGVYVCRIRKKLLAAGARDPIRVRRGVGYYWDSK